MNFITYAERVGIEKGMQLGMEQGMERGMEKGVQLGERLALLRMLSAALQAKFGEEGAALLAQVPLQAPLAHLEELVLLAAVETKIDTLRSRFTPNPNRAETRSSSATSGAS